MILMLVNPTRESYTRNPGIFQHEISSRISNDFQVLASFSNEIIPQFTFMSINRHFDIFSDFQSAISKTRSEVDKSHQKHRVHKTAHPSCPTRYAEGLFSVDVVRCLGSTYECACLGLSYIIHFSLPVTIFHKKFFLHCLTSNGMHELNRRPMLSSESSCGTPRKEYLQVLWERTPSCFRISPLSCSVTIEGRRWRLAAADRSVAALVSTVFESQDGDEINEAIQLLTQMLHSHPALMASKFQFPFYITAISILSDKYFHVVVFSFLSLAYRDYMDFLHTLNDEVKGVKTTDDVLTSPAVLAVIDMLSSISNFINDYPPEDMGNQRFGNKSYRKWYKRLVEVS
uniref:Serine/threonine-protein phosphatase 2A activator n=1 Tax=Heterorhabditis bacteriophora TaxID=37862 RepID=A0A1I7WQP0_HETBA